MEEWKCLKDTNINTQKILNQWRHKYHIVIHGMSIDESGLVIVLLTRQHIKKEN